MSSFVLISPSDLIKDVVPFDVNDFTKREFIFPVLLCRNIKPFRFKMFMYICRFLCLYDIGRGKGFSIFECTVDLFLLILPCIIGVAYPYM